MRMRYLWSKKVELICQPIMCNHNGTLPQVFQSRILFIGCTHNKEINA